jgi:predicted nuclease with RNAse H fold
MSKGDTVAAQSRSSAVSQPTRERTEELPRGLTRAEAHALRRSQPLTPSQFKSLRRLAEQGVSPLRHL